MYNIKVYCMYTYVCTIYVYMYIHHNILNTVESLLRDTPNKGHNTKYLSTKDTFGGIKNGLSYGSNTFFTSVEWTTSLQWTN